MPVTYQNRIVRASITVVGSYVVGVDGNGALCQFRKTVGWRRVKAMTVPPGVVGPKKYQARPDPRNLGPAGVEARVV